MGYILPQGMISFYTFPPKRIWLVNRGREQLLSLATCYANGISINYDRIFTSETDHFVPFESSFYSRSVYCRFIL